MKKGITKSTENLVQYEYLQLLEHIKTDILQTQLKAAVSMTTELTMLYWRIGKYLSAQTEQNNWGAKIIEKLAQDIKSLLPGMSGFSSRNLVSIRKFANTYDTINCAAAAAQLPWGHNMVLLDSLDNNDQRL